MNLLEIGGNILDYAADNPELAESLLNSIGRLASDYPELSMEELKQLAIQEQVMQNPDIFTPSGSSTTQIDPESGKAIVTQAYTPQVQALFESLVGRAGAPIDVYQNPEHMGQDMLGGLMNERLRHMGLPEKPFERRDLSQPGFDIPDFTTTPTTNSASVGGGPMGAGGHGEIGSGGTGAARHWEKTGEVNAVGPNTMPGSSTGANVPGSGGPISNPLTGLTDAQLGQLSKLSGSSLLKNVTKLIPGLGPRLAAQLGIAGVEMLVKREAQRRADAMMIPDPNNPFDYGVNPHDETADMLEGGTDYWDEVTEDTLNPADPVYGKDFGPGTARNIYIGGGGEGSGGRGGSENWGGYSFGGAGPWYRDSSGRHRFAPTGYVGGSGTSGGGGGGGGQAGSAGGAWIPSWALK